MGDPNYPLMPETWYRKDVKTLVSHEQWKQMWEAYKHAASPMSAPSDEDFLISAGFPKLYAAQAAGEKRRSCAIVPGTWKWILGATEDEAAEKAASFVLNGRDNAHGLQYLDAADLAHAWNEGELFGPKAKAKCTEPYKGAKTLVITHIGVSGMREEADALVELLEHRRRNRSTTILASSSTSKTVSRNFIHSGAAPETVQHLISCISSAIKDSKGSK